MIGTTMSSRRLGDRLNGILWNIVVADLGRFLGIVCMSSCGWRARRLLEGVVRIGAACVDGGKIRMGNDSKKELHSTR